MNISFLRAYFQEFLSQIENDGPLEYLTEVRKITVVSVNIVPGKCSIYELISLVDEAFKIIERYRYIYQAGIRKKCRAIFFRRTLNF